MFQELCRNDKQWDEPLAEPLERQWNDCIADLQRVCEITVPRCYLDSTAGDILSTELHGFSDASNTTYAGAVNLRFTTESGTVTRLVASKSRVAPLSPTQTIPRSERLRALILARLYVRIKEVL